MKPRIIILIVLLLGVAVLSYAAAVGDYRSKATGDLWDAASSWETCSVPGTPGTWVNTLSSPDENAGVITISSGSYISVMATQTADQIIVESGGTLYIDGNIDLTLNDGSGIDLDVSSGGTLSLAGKVNTSTGASVRISGSYADVSNSCQIYGYGSVEITSGATLDTKNTSGLYYRPVATYYGCLALTSRTISSGANYIFSSTANQATYALPSSVNNITVSASATRTVTLQGSLAANTVSITSGALTLGGNVTTNSLSLNNKTLNFASNYLTLNNQHISIGGTAQNITALAVTEDTATIHDLGAVSSISRTWTTTGTQSGAVNLVFRYPVTSGTNVHIWSRTSSPVGSWVDKGGFVSGANTVTITGVNAFDNLDWTISENETLPIELSSFTVTQTSDFFVQLHWITQSETGVSGFYVYRNTVLDLTGAAIVSPFIPATNTSSETTYSYVDTEVAPGTWYYWLQNVDMDGDNTFHGPISIVINDGSGNPPPVIPTLTSLDKVYPNPFNPLTTISYGLAKSENVSIQVYNIKGQPVRTLVSGAQSGGTYRLQWNGTNDNGRALSSGVYYIKMTAGKYTTTQKAILMK